jgi:hypothetical protein
MMHGNDSGRGGFGGHDGGFGEFGWGSTSTTLAAGATTATGGTGFDVVTLNSAGNTITVSAVEYLIGGAGTDVVTLADSGNTLAARGLETLIGGVGTDVVLLSGFGNTIAVSGVETLIGCGGADIVTITSGTVNFVASGGDVLTLAASNGADQVVLQEANYRPYNDSDGYAQVTNFQAGTDTLVVSGALRNRVDDNSDGVIASGSRATGAVDLSTDEIVQLTTSVSSLTDTDYASVRAAIGTIANSSKGADALILANDGTNTGVYLVVDSNGDGAVAANEIRLLSVLKSTTGVTASDLVYG